MRGILISSNGTTSTWVGDLGKDADSEAAII